MKKKALFLIILLVLSLLTVAGCEDGSFTIDDDTLVIAVGDNVLIPYTTEDSSVVVTILSSDDSIATVAGNYVVGIKVGEAMLTLTDSETTKTVAVSVIANYNEDYVNVTFQIDPPSNNSNILPYKKVVQKKYYNPIKESSNVLINDVPSVLDIWPDGYAFSGWCTNPDCTVKAVFPVEIGTEDITFYGKWVIRDGTAKNDVNIELNYEYSTAGGVYQATVTGFTYPTVPYETIVIPATISLGEATYTVTSIKAEAFKNNKTLQSVEMSSIVNIGDNAFSGCTKLNTVKVDHLKLKTLGKQAFFNSGLTNLNTYTTASFEDFNFANLGLDAFTNTPFIASQTQSSRYIWINNQTENVPAYLGLLIAKVYIAYNAEYVASNFNNTITFDNLEVKEVACTFDSDIKIVLMGYDNSTPYKDANTIKQMFVERGVSEENITIV